MEYRKPPYQNLVQGLDLELDSHTQKICETYNQSSGASRSVLYVILIVSVVALIAVFNSNPIYNWPSERISNYKKRIIETNQLLQKLEDSNDYYNQLKYKNQLITDSVGWYQVSKALKRVKLDSAQLRLEEEATIKSNVDSNTVKVSIIGIQIDLNDLASISGLSFTILLFLLRFTLQRETSNLKLAFNSISERYPDDADFGVFKKNVSEHEAEIIGNETTVLKGLKASWVKLTNLQVKPIKSRVKKSNKSWQELIADINFTRRQSHYNFLSMNEIFNMPFLAISENKLQNTVTGKIVNRYLFYFFFTVYSYILFNDFCSYDQGMKISNFHTFVIMVMSMAFYFLIYRLCQVCVNQKYVINRLFSDFYHGQYLLDYDQDYSIQNSGFLTRYFLPVLLLLAMDWLSQFFRSNSPFWLSLPFVKGFFKYFFHY